MTDAKLRRVPAIFIRFEDLVNDPKPQLETMMMFFCNMSTIEGTNAQRKVEQVIMQGKEKTQTYQLKDSTLQFNSHLKKYTQEQLEFVKNELREFLIYFGYAKLDSDPSNFTAFYQYEESEQIRQEYYGYRKLNDSVLKWISTMTDKEMCHFQYQLCDPAKNLDITHFAKDQTLILRPINNWNERKLYRQ